MPTVAAELQLSKRLSKIIEWLDRIEEPALARYVAGARTQARWMFLAFEKNGAAR